MHRLLSTFLLIGFLSACSNVSPTPIPTPEDLPTPEFRVSAAPSPTAGRTPATSPTQFTSTLGIQPEELDGTTIQFWHVWVGDSGEALEDLVTEFNITNPFGIRVDAISQESYSDLSGALEESIRRAEGPNLTVGFNNQLHAWDTRWSILRDLNDYVDDPEWGLTPEEQKDFYPLFWNQDVVDGKRLGLPAQRSAQILFYNLSWAEELGFETPPADLDDFRQQTCAAARANREDGDPTNDSTGGWVIDTSTATVFSWVTAFGGQIESQSGYDFETDQVGEAFSFLKELFDEGCGWLSSNQYPNPEFASRRALFISSSTAGIPFQERAFEDSDSSDEWVGIAFPGQDGAVIDAFGPSFAILKSTPEQELASWLLVNWLLEPENQARWIRVSGHLPSRADVVDELGSYPDEHPQWADAMNLLPNGYLEPRHASWGNVRWALSDAAEQIFRLGLTSEQFPALIEELGQTAAELHARQQ